MFDPLKPYVIPSEWTADHVMTRMKWAFQTLDRMKMRIGPTGTKSNWPAYVYEFADRVAQEEAPVGAEKSEAENMRLNSASFTRVRLPPSGREIDLMEEAFQWPVHHLAELRRPQITVWARAMTRDGPPPQWLKIERVYYEAGVIVTGLRREKVQIR